MTKSIDWMLINSRKNWEMPEYRIRTLCVVCESKSLWSQFKELLVGYRDMKYCSMECFIKSDEKVK